MQTGLAAAVGDMSPRSDRIDQIKRAVTQTDNATWQNDTLVEQTAASLEGQARSTMR